MVRLYIESRLAAGTGDDSPAQGSPCSTSSTSGGSSSGGGGAGCAADPSGVTAAMLTFVDLAGSERATQVAGEAAEQERLRQKEVGGCAEERRRSYDDPICSAARVPLSRAATVAWPCCTAPGHCMLRTPLLIAASCWQHNRRATSTRAC